MADFEHIRALLIAQTAEPAPKPARGFGRWFAPKASSRSPAESARPMRLDPPASPKPEGAPTPTRAETELTLENTLNPKPEAETAGPLAPPAPRAAFGRRPEALPEPELVLDQPATHARRLQLIDLDGQPVGEMILAPDVPPGATVMVSGEVPYFPEDLMDHSPPHGPEPLRPWLKALRKSGPPKAEARAAPTPEAEAEPEVAAETPRPPAKRASRRRSKPAPANHSTLTAEKIDMGPTAHPAPPEERTLGQDLMDALALALSREHETLSDRLFALHQSAPFALPETAVGGDTVEGLLCLPTVSPFDDIRFTRYADEP